MVSVLEELKRGRLIPVVVLDDAADAGPVGEALLAGGLGCAEITFRTAAAAGAIQRLAAMKGLLVGAGTVVSVEQCSRAVGAGAKFIVSPGLSREVVEWCLRREVPVYPGVCTPTDVLSAMALGLEVLKFFPAESYGGVATLKALAGPFPTASFIPTGGIDLENLRDYLSLPAVVACGGSWLVKRELIRAKDFARITELARQAVALIASL